MCTQPAPGGPDFPFCDFHYCYFSGLSTLCPERVSSPSVAHFRILLIFPPLNNFCQNCKFKIECEIVAKLSFHRGLKLCRPVITPHTGKVQDTVYATPLCQRQEAHHTTTSSSTATEVQGTGGGKDQGASIYSNISVSSESQTQPDGLVYSTVTFNRHCDSVKPRPAVVTYSTVNNISTDESTVYCNV